MFSFMSECAAEVPVLKSSIAISKSCQSLCLSGAHSSEVFQGSRNHDPPGQVFISQDVSYIKIICPFSRLKDR